MVDMDWLDDEVAAVETWVVKAAGSLLSLYDEVEERFFRERTSQQADGSTPQVDADRVDVKGRVSTVLAVPTLFEYLRFLDEDPESFAAPSTAAAIEQIMCTESDYRSADPTRGNVRTVAIAAAESMAKWPGTSMGTEYSSPHYLQAGLVTGLYSATAYCSMLAREQRSTADANRETRFLEAADCAANALSEALGGERNWRAAHGSSEGDQQSHLVTFHAARARDVLEFWDARKRGQPPDDGALWLDLGEVTRSHLLSQLGYHDAGMGARFRVADLTFSTCLLDRLEAANARQLVARAAAIITQEQLPDGSWSSLPTVSRRDEILHCSSYDIAFTLSCLLLNQFKRRDWSLAEDVLTALGRTFALAQTMRETIRWKGGCASGWSGSTSRSDQVVTGWGTARVLSFLLRYREALLARRQRHVLDKYVVQDSRPLRGPVWFDLIPVLSSGTRQSGKKRADDRLRRISDPSKEQQLDKALAGKLVLPVLDTHIERPKNASFLLSGPPGSRKTSLVRAVAESLNWPLLTLSPPDFLREGGIAGLQVVASEVFRDLLRLRRTVVLLDECEELFRTREVVGNGKRDGDTSVRTDAAFFTAAMLPRLQALRDRRWTIFAMATNAKPERVLDEAVLREGRFDFQIAMTMPSLEAQKAYVDRELRRARESGQVLLPQKSWDVAFEIICDALCEVGRREEPNDGRKDISWALLDLIVRRALRGMLDPAMNKDRLQTELERVLNKSLTSENGPRFITDATLR